MGTEVLSVYRNESVDFDSPESRLRIYNILLSMSTMKGTQYYSASRERMRTLFAESYVVDGPNRQNRLPDPVVQEIPPTSKLTVLQEDLTFGENLYPADPRRGGIAVLRSGWSPHHAPAGIGTLPGGFLLQSFEGYLRLVYPENGRCLLRIRSPRPGFDPAAWPGT